MKVDRNFISKEHEKLYKRLINQMKQSKNQKDREFLWHYTTKFAGLQTKYDNHFQTYY